MTTLCGQSGLPVGFCTHCETERLRALVGAMPKAPRHCRPDSVWSRRERKGLVVLHERKSFAPKDMLCALDFNHEILTGEAVGVAKLHVIRKGVYRELRIGLACSACVKELRRRGTVARDRQRHVAFGIPSSEVFVGG